MVKTHKTARKSSNVTPRKKRNGANVASGKIKRISTIESVSTKTKSSNSRSSSNNTKTTKTAYSVFQKPKISQGPVKKRKKPAVSNVLKEIKYFQTHVGFLVPRASMVRVVKDIVNGNEDIPFRFTATSFDVLQEAYEAYVVNVLEYANVVARHAKRKTLFASDISLVLRIKNGM